jgi:hypothetical protein
VRCLPGGLVQGSGLRLLQDLGGEEDGFAVVVLHGVASLEHGDQQRGAGRLDGEQDTNVAVRGRARAEFHQPPGRRLQVQLLFDLADDLVKPGRRPGGIVRPDGIVAHVLSLLDQLHRLGRRVGRLQDFLPGPEGVDPHLLPLGLHGQPLFRRHRRGEPLLQPGGVRRRLQLGELALDVLSLHRRLGHPTAHGSHRFQPVLIVLVQRRRQLVRPRPDRRHGGHQRGAETVASVGQGGQRLGRHHGGRRVAVAQLGQPVIDLRGHLQPVAHNRRLRPRAASGRKRPGPAGLSILWEAAWALIDIPGR